MLPGFGRSKSTLDPRMIKSTASRRRELRAHRMAFRPRHQAHRALVPRRSSLRGIRRREDSLFEIVARLFDGQKADGARRSEPVHQASAEEGAAVHVAFPARRW